MRKIIVQEMISVDGFFCGPKGEINWHNVDAEFNEHAIAFLDTIDTFIFGHTTYDVMASYWPMPDAINDDPLIAEKMNSLHKLVFSKTMEKADWNNSEVLHEIDKDMILKMKESEGKNIAIFGSGEIVSALASLDLIDDYKFIVNPVILKEGKTVFAGIDKQHDLELVSTKAFANGNVELYYKAKK